ncbi:MAG TPA: cytochrome b/b6 domain-containing protein [Candidatus Limnocylindria bacterium]|nr:cytochrome b/b6 domain-containing protein [Candidatus Limnocylindria bacterium]
MARFTRGQRWAHSVTGVLMLACLASAAALYIDPLSVAVGQRAQVRAVHLWSGYLLPLPVIIALLLSPAMRRDARTVDGFTPADREWLRARDRRSGRIRVGKFNAGQKLNAAVTSGAVLVMILTGSVMLDLLGIWPLGARTGATFVHDWVALGMFLLLAGHLWFALRDSEAMRGITAGTVSQDWARREHEAWHDAELAPSAGVARSAGVAQPGGDAIDGEPQGPT